MAAQHQAEAPPQSENELDASKKPVGKFETIANLASSALQSAAYEGLQQPLTSLGQYVDHFKDIHLTEKLQFIAPVKETHFGTVEWHVEQLAAAAGQMLPYLAARYMVKPLFAERALLAKSGFFSKASPLGFSVAEAGATGFVSQTLFHPVENKDNFWSEKIIDGGKGALTMGTLTATTHGLSFLAQKELASTLKVSGVLKNSIASGVISGAPAGFLGAEMDSIQKQGQLASLSDITKSIYGMSMVGGTFGAIAHRAAGADRVKPADDMKPAVPEKIVEPAGTQLSFKFDEPHVRILDEKAVESVPLRPEGVDNQQFELKFPEPLSAIGERAYEVLRHLENMPKEDNAKITEGKYPIRMIEAQSIHVLLDEWSPGAQRLYDVIAARGPVARSMAYDSWVNSSINTLQEDFPRFYERGLIQGHPDNNPLDRSKFVGQNPKRGRIGIETPEEADRFLSVWRRTNPITAWLDYQGDIHCKTLMKMIRWGHVDEIPDAALRPIAEHFRAYESPFTDDLDVKALIAAAPGWEATPFVPIDIATKLAQMPAQKRLAADPALMAIWNEFAVHGDSFESLLTGENREKIQAAFFKNLDEISLLHPRAVIKKMGYEDALPLAIDVVYGDTISPEHRFALLQGINSFTRSAQILAGLDLPTFTKAFDKLIDDNPVSEDAKKDRYFDWQARSAIILSTVFKKNWSNWLDTQQKAGRDNFQATTWLPADEPIEFKGLSQFLLQHGKKSVDHLERISAAWSEVKVGDKTSDYKEALRIGLLSKYGTINDPAFAEEASRWNVPREKYESYERRFIASKDVPSPFPMDEKWSVGGLTGRFIPRDDPRGLFLGEHTNCCQSPDGNGESNAWFGQENPKSGFFVVEDSNGEVVAQSWSVVTDDGGLLFDNVEAKGLDKRQDAVKQIYLNAATSLTSRFHTITMGTSNSDLNLTGMPDAGVKAHKLPVGFSGYTDAKEQVLLASSDTVEPSAFVKPIIRGALSLDKPGMSEISKERFPEAWQALPWEPATRGLVLDYKKDGLLGYALFEPANRRVSDIAIKSGTHPKYGYYLTANLFKALRDIGGDWTADTRTPATYRMVQRAAELGRVKIISDTVQEAPLGTEQVHRVVFNVDKAKANATEAVENDGTEQTPVESQP
jgi:hypothetical protein